MLGDPTHGGGDKASGIPDEPTIEFRYSTNGVKGVPFGDWLLLERLGTGTADVWRAQNDNYGVVALKILAGARLAFSPDPVAGRRFTGEYDTLKRMNHPHIVQVFDFGETNGSLWFAMRLVEGHSLMHLIGEYRGGGKTMPRWMACGFVQQIAFALHYAHTSGVVHRDVKPHNILIEKSGDAILADFGIAKLIDQEEHLTRTGRIFGTVAYMSPEQCEGREATPASDIYSLGCVLYQCLNPFGEPPFVGNTASAVMMQHARRPIRLLVNPQVNDALMRIIAVALAKEPGDRFASAAEFGRALKPFV